MRYRLHSTRSRPGCGTQSLATFAQEGFTGSIRVHDPKRHQSKADSCGREEDALVALQAAWWSRLHTVLRLSQNQAMKSSCFFASLSRDGNVRPLKRLLHVHCEMIKHEHWTQSDHSSVLLFHFVRFLGQLEMSSAGLKVASALGRNTSLPYPDNVIHVWCTWCAGMLRGRCTCT